MGNKFKKKPIRRRKTKEDKYYEQINSMIIDKKVGYEINLDYYKREVK